MQRENNYGISVLIPLTEDRIPKRTIQSVISQDCMAYEIIILQNDVSKVPENPGIREVEIIGQFSDAPIRKFQIHRKGKGNALNIGIRNAKYDFICVLDADCVLEEKALRRAMTHFKRENVVAVGGRLRVIEEDKSLLEQAQKCSYRNTFQIVRSVFATINGQVLISGAFGVFRRIALEAIDGYDTDTVGEDMEIILRLQDSMGKRSSNRIVYEKNAVCRTFVPSDIKRLQHQRERWQRGLMDCLIKHKNMIGNPSYGTLGIVMLFQYIVELYGPFILPLITLFMIGILCLFKIPINPISVIATHVILHYSCHVFAAVMENRKKLLLVIRQMPMLFIITIVIIIGQIPLMIARIYGMIHFKERRLLW